MIKLIYNKKKYSLDGKVTYLEDSKIKIAISFDETYEESGGIINIKTLLAPKSDVLYTFKTVDGILTIYYDEAVYVTNLLSDEQFAVIKDIYKQCIEINAKLLLPLLENIKLKKKSINIKNDIDPLILIKPSLVALAMVVVLWTGVWIYIVNLQRVGNNNQHSVRVFYIMLENLMTEKAGGILNGLNPRLYKQLLSMSLKIPAYKVSGYDFENTRITGNKDKTPDLNVKVIPEFDVYVDGRDLEKFGEMVRDGSSYSVKIKL